MWLGLYKGKYSLTFEFKQDKIKMELTNLMVYNKPSQTTVGGCLGCLLGLLLSDNLFVKKIMLFLRFKPI